MNPVKPSIENSLRDRQPSALAAEPRIRFKEFGGAWKARPLGESFDERNERSGIGRLLSVTIGDGVIPASENGKRDNSSADKSNYKCVKTGDLAYNSMRMWQGACGASAFDGIVSPAYTVLIPKEGTDSPFAERLFKRTKILKIFQTYSQGLTSDTWNLKYPALSEIELAFPSLPEQQRIAELFRNLDETIAATDARLEKLRQSKKSLLEKMFPRPGASVPEIRFKGFEGEWETRKLGEIATLITRKNTAMESNLPLTISAERGLVSQTTYFNNRVAAQNVVHYYLILNGEFAYNRSSSDGSPFGAVKRLDSFENGVLSTLYTVFSLKREMVDSDFISVFFSTALWHRDVRLRAAEGARNHGLLNISASDFFETEVLSPVSMPEQQRIGSFFRELDKLIDSVQKKAAKLRQVKSALLEEMFV